MTKTKNFSFEDWEKSGIYSRIADAGKQVVDRREQAMNFIKANPVATTKALIIDAKNAAVNAVKKHPGVAAGVAVVPVAAGTVYALTNKNKAEQEKAALERLVESKQNAEDYVGRKYAELKNRYDNDPNFRRNVNIGTGVAGAAALAGIGTLAYKLYQKSKAKKSKYSR